MADGFPLHALEQRHQRDGHIREHENREEGQVHHLFDRLGGDVRPLDDDGQQAVEEQGDVHVAQRPDHIAEGRHAHEHRHQGGSGPCGGMTDFEGRLTRYDFTMLDELEHAYAITVHKSQGSEYPFVIIPIYNCTEKLLTRNLLYTAVTRAQKMVILVGRAKLVSAMVDNNRQTKRYTGLGEILSDGENIYEKYPDRENI